MQDCQFVTEKNDFVCVSFGKCFSFLKKWNSSNSADGHFSMTYDMSCDTWLSTGV